MSPRQPIEEGGECQYYAAKRVDNYLQNLSSTYELYANIRIEHIYSLMGDFQCTSLKSLSNKS